MPKRKAATKEAKDEKQAPRPGAFWSGTITFGLVSVPVHLYPAHRSEPTALRMLAPDGTPVARRYYCEQDGDEVGNEHLVRGFEVEDGKHVVITDEELERLAPEKTRDIELRRFVDSGELDPVQFDRPYLLTPGSSAGKAYRLLAAVMERSQRAGIATFVMNGKERIIAILAEDGILRAETLRFADEIRTPKDIGLPEPSAADKARVSSFQKLIQSRAKPGLAREELADPYVEGLTKLVEKKSRQGGKVVKASRDDEDGAEVIDLVDVLRRSISGESKQSSRKPARAAASGRRPRRAASRA